MSKFNVYSDFNNILHITDADCSSTFCNKPIKVYVSKITMSMRKEPFKKKYVFGLQALNNIINIVSPKDFCEHCLKIKNARYATFKQIDDVIL